VPAAGDLVTISGKSVNLSASATLASLTLTGGASLTVASNGSRVLRASTLFIDGNSKLNLNDNDVILDYPGASPIGSWNGSAYTGVTGMIQSGQITSSAGPLTRLGVGEVAGDVLVKYTYAGDANLDGKINILDYTRIDAGISAHLNGWSNGDFNYDGKINIEDYVIIDQNIRTQGPPFSSAFANTEQAASAWVGRTSLVWDRSDDRKNDPAELLEMEG
jgi:hypothetical protein